MSQSMQHRDHWSKEAKKKAISQKCQGITATLHANSNQNRSKDSSEGQARLAQSADGYIARQFESECRGRTMTLVSAVHGLILENARCCLPRFGRINVCLLNFPVLLNQWWDQCLRRQIARTTKLECASATRPDGKIRGGQHMQPKVDPGSCRNIFGCDLGCCFLLEFLGQKNPGWY